MTDRRLRENPRPMKTGLRRHLLVGLHQDESVGKIDAVEIVGKAMSFQFCGDVLGAWSVRHILAEPLH